MLYLNNETIKLLDDEHDRQHRDEKVRFNLHPELGQTMFKAFLNRFVLEFDIQDDAVDAIFSSSKIVQFYRSYWCNAYVKRVWRSLMDLRLLLEKAIDKGYINVRDFSTIVRDPIIQFYDENNVPRERSILDMLMDGNVDQNYWMIKSLRDGMGIE